MTILRSILRFILRELVAILHQFFQKPSWPPVAGPRRRPTEAHNGRTTIFCVHSLCRTATNRAHETQLLTRTAPHTHTIHRMNANGQILSGGY